MKYYIIVQHNNKLRYQGTEAKIIYDVLLTGCKSKFYEDEVKMYSLNVHFKDCGCHWGKNLIKSF